MDVYGGAMGVMGAMGGMGGMGGMGMPSMNGMGQMNNRRPQAYQPPDQKRGICRDYHSTFFTMISGLSFTFWRYYLQTTDIAPVVLCANIVMEKMPSSQANFTR